MWIQALVIFSNPRSRSGVLNHGSLRARRQRNTAAYVCRLLEDAVYSRPQREKDGELLKLFQMRQHGRKKKMSEDFTIEEESLLRRVLHLQRIFWLKT